MAGSMRGRTTGDLVVGGLIVLLGLVILGHTATATTLSILFVGWVMLIIGLVALVATLFRIGKEGFWTGAIGGGLMTVLGLVFLRHTSAAAVMPPPLRKINRPAIVTTMPISWANVAVNGRPAA